jgi:hypothetical protein
MTDERIIAYLLEELPEEELEQFEDECIAQESLPSQINLVEEDLIDAYLRGELTPEQRQHFEQNYLTTELRQERVVMTAALLRHVDERQAVARTTVAVQPAEQTWSGRFRAFWSSQSWALRAAAALALVAILAGAWWFTRLRTPSPQTFATLTLTMSSSNRAEGAQAGTIKLPLPASALRISLMLPERLSPAVRYRVELENINNGEIKSLEITGQDAQSVSVVIPAEELRRGQYALKLFAVQAGGTEQRISGKYFFDVE